MTEDDDLEQMDKEFSEAAKKAIQGTAAMNLTVVNKSIMKENAELTDQLKQRDETIKQLKEALREERNKAIDECMREIERLNDDGVLYESTARKVLEFLKSDSK